MCVSICIWRLLFTPGLNSETCSVWLLQVCPKHDGARYGWRWGCCRGKATNLEWRQQNGYFEITRTDQGNLLPGSVSKSVFALLLSWKWKTVCPAWNLCLGLGHPGPLFPWLLIISLKLLASLGASGMYYFPSCYSIVEDLTHSCKASFYFAFCWHYLWITPCNFHLLYFIMKNIKNILNVQTKSWCLHKNIFFSFIRLIHLDILISKIVRFLETMCMFLAVFT